MSDRVVRRVAASAGLDHEWGTLHLFMLAPGHQLPNAPRDSPDDLITPAELQIWASYVRVRGRLLALLRTDGFVSHASPWLAVDKAARGVHK
jgi:hypothetical protein